MHNDDLSLEFLTMYNVFERTNSIRRTSDLNAKTAYSGDSMILPKNVMLHMLDNFGHSDQTSDTIDIARYPFLTGKNNLKYLHNFIDFEAVPKDELNKFSHRLFKPKLIETLKAYGMANRRTLIPVPKFDAVIGNKNAIIVENYNPLYRYITTNNRPISHYWRYRAFLRTVLDNMKNFDRLHMLVIPVPEPFEYVRSNIMAIIQTGEVSSQKLISNSHFYFFIIDLVALLLDNNSRLSSLNTTDKRTLNELTVMITNKDKSIVFNIGKLAMLARTKTYVFSFIDNISRLSGVNIPITVLADAEADPMLEEAEDEKDASDLPVIKPAQQVNQPIIKNTVITPVKSVVEPVVSVIKPASRTIHQETKTPDEKKPEEAKKEETLNDLLPPKEDEPVDSTLPPMTDKQKDRVAILAEKYKSIKVTTPEGVKTVHDIISEKIDTTLVKPPAGDDSTTASTVKEYDTQYQDKLLRKDILTNILAFSDNGLFLVDYVEKNEYNSFTRVKHIKASFQDINGKKHTINLKLPMPDEDGYYLVNGIHQTLSKQLVNVPICKISPTRVSLISNYNKTLVDKIESSRHSLTDHIAKKGTNISLIPKANTYIGINVPYDYKNLGSSYNVITTQAYEFFFEYKNRVEHFKVNVSAETLAELEQSYGVLFGSNLADKNIFVFMNNKNQCTEFDIARFTVSDRGKSIIHYFDDMKVPAEWCNLKILDKNLPIIFILGYRYGLSTVVRNLGIAYTFVKPGEKYVIKPTEIIIPFKDGKLIFDRYPLEHSYLLAGLTYFNTLKDIPIIDMDGKDAYYILLTDKGMSTNYLKGIDAYFNFFIDPITKEILQEMGEPTNTRDLLIRAVDMLINDKDKQPSALSNFRVRGAERLPAMIYNEIARQYADYINSNYKDLSFSINAEAIFQRLVQDQTMGLREDINPIKAIKEQSKVTYTGFGGRSSEAFVQRDRKYPEDALGILSETTTDSGSVGMVSALSGDPKIINLRGMFDTNQENLTAENTYSDVTLLLPGATHDDPKRLTLNLRIISNCYSN
jgi:hypothetical protein